MNARTIFNLNSVNPVGSDPQSSSCQSMKTSKINNRGKNGDYMHESISNKFVCAGINQPCVELIVAKIVAGLIATWIIAWTPYTIVSLFGVTGYTNLITVCQAWPVYS